MGFEGLTGAGLASKLTHMDTVRSQFFTSHGTENLRSLMQRRPSVPCCMVLSLGQLKALQLRMSFVYVFFFFRANEKEHASFCSLMTEGTHCYHAVFHSLEADHWIQPSLREKTEPEGELSGVRDTWGPS